MTKFWISKKSPEGWQRKAHRKCKKEDCFWAENWRSMRKELGPLKASDNSAVRNSPFWCNCATTLWIWNGMTVPVMSCRAIKFASLIGKWLKERAYSQVKRALWNVGWCAIGDDICNCVGHHVMYLLPYLLPDSLCFINVRTSFHKYRKSKCLLFLCYQHLNKNVENG